MYQVQLHDITEKGIVLKHCTIFFCKVLPTCSISTLHGYLVRGGPPTWTRLPALHSDPPAPDQAGLGVGAAVAATDGGTVPEMIFAALVAKLLL